MIDDKLKKIQNIDSKLNILYKNMNKNEFKKFIDNNKLVCNYNQILNNISLGIMPKSMILLLPDSILKEINDSVVKELINYVNNKIDNKTELLLI